MTSHCSHWDNARLVPGPNASRTAGFPAASAANKSNPGGGRGEGCGEGEELDGRRVEWARVGAGMVATSATTFQIFSGTGWLNMGLFGSVPSQIWVPCSIAVGCCLPGGREKMPPSPRRSKAVTWQGQDPAITILVSLESWLLLGSRSGSLCHWISSYLWRKGKNVL